MKNYGFTSGSKNLKYSSATYKKTECKNSVEKKGLRKNLRNLFDDNGNLSEALTKDLISTGFFVENKNVFAEKYVEFFEKHKDKLFK